MDKKIHVQVPVEITGQAIGVKEEGGLLEHLTRHLNIECLAGMIPPSIQIDVSELRLGKAIHISDLTLPEGAKALDDPTQVITMIVGKTVEDEEDKEKETEEEEEA